MQSNNHVTFKKGEKKREELSLPHMYYVVADNWIDTLSEKTFCLWLKFITICDRSDSDRENDKIPDSIAGVAERFGMSKNTFMKHIKTLWNYGLIDLEEYAKSKNEGQKPINIIVYEAPQNRTELMIKPLEKVRDYAKDYNSAAKKFAARKKKKASGEQAKKPAVKRVSTPVQKTERAPVQKIERAPVQKIEPNNVSNIYSNVSNIYNNYLSIIEQNFDDQTAALLIQNIDRLTDTILNDLQTIYKAFNHDMQRFTLKLAAALASVKDNNKLAAYLKTALINPDKPGQAAAGAAARVETVPEWLKGQQQAQEAEELTPEDLAAIEEMKARLQEKYKPQAL